MNNLGQQGGGGGEPTLLPPDTPQTYNEAFSLNKRKTSWSNHGKSQHLRKLCGRHVHLFSEIFCMREIFHNFYEVYKWWKRNETMTLKTRIESDEDLNMQKQVPLGHRRGGRQGETLLPTSLSTHLVVFPGLFTTWWGGLSPPQPGAASETHPPPVPTTILTLITKTDV